MTRAWVVAASVGTAMEALSMWQQGPPPGVPTAVAAALGGAVVYALIVWTALTLLPRSESKDAGRMSGGRSGVPLAIPERAMPPEVDARSGRRGGDRAEAASV